MSDQMEKKFTWVLEEFSSLKDDMCYSRPFVAARCDWRLLAYPKGDRNDGYLSVYLELAPGSLPPGWRRDVKFRLTLVNKGWGKLNTVLEGQSCFDAKESSWGFKEFLSLFKLHHRREGFLVNDRLFILAEVLVLPAIVVQEEPVKIFEQPLSSKNGNQASDASVSKSQGDSCQMAQKTENDSKENLDGDTCDEGTDDDGSCEEDLDDDCDASSPVSDGGGRDISHLNQSFALVENDGVRCNNVEAETEVSNGENEDAPKEDVDDEASSLVSNDSARDGSSLDQVKSLEDAFETSNKLLKEIQPVKETMDVNGFEVSSAQVELVSHVFRRHPDIALGFRPKNQQIKSAYMNALVSLIETMCQSPEKLSEDDLCNAEEILVDLIDAGFKLDWLKTKLNEVSEKRKMMQGSVAHIQTMEEQLQKLKLMFLDLETQLQKEKAEALAARAPLSLNDVVC